MDILNQQVEQLEIGEAEPQKEEIWKIRKLAAFEFGLLVGQKAF